MRDRESGVESVTLLWRRFDGKGWNGSEWTTSSTELPLSVTGINWSYEGNLPAPGADADSDLLNGNYDLRVTAVDKSGNKSQLTNRITISDRAAAPDLSTVRLSSAGASAEQSAIILRFTGALDNGAASDTMNYAVSINGIETKSVRPIMRAMW